MSRLLASQITVGDEIAFRIPTGDTAAPEICITKTDSSGNNRCLYQAPVGYVTQPKLDKRQQHFVSAQVEHGNLGISAIFLPCEALREYFYRLPQAEAQAKGRNLYEVLAVSSSAAPAEIRLAFKLRHLELTSTGAARGEQVAAERAFNILGHPELRACYDMLLTDPEAPAVFPYGGFGSIVATGERSREGNVFFANRILVFLPEHRSRRFHLSLRNCESYDDRALCRDVRRKLEFWIDPAVLHTVWSPSWNRWKHLLRARLEVDGTFVRSSKYRKRDGNGELIIWETALPSRLGAKLPAGFPQELETARTTYHRFGQYSRALDQIRSCLEHKAIERTDLERMCSAMGIPADFDIAQISWRRDYDPLFYRQLSRRARRVYLFRCEYIFDLEKAVIVETPQQGHATYVFAKPRSMETFLTLYAKVTKDDIRRNRDNIGERLGFIRRLDHGRNPRLWIQEIIRRADERPTLPPKS
ncbi:MAG: hypothetical protein ACHQIK_10640 [Candidatus Acidiferrales bacterium]